MLGRSVTVQRAGCQGEGRYPPLTENAPASFSWRQLLRSVHKKRPQKSGGGVIQVGGDPAPHPIRCALNRIALHVDHRPYRT